MDPKHIEVTLIPFLERSAIGFTEKLWSLLLSAQKDPLAEYTEEAFYMFEQMTSSIADTISRNIVHMGVRPGSETEQKIPHLKMELTFK